MIAALPMYDWPEIRAGTDAFWRGVRDRLRAAGIDAPAALDRDRELDAIWSDPALLLAQTCGYPYAARLRGTVRLVATPRYAVEGCTGATYRSAVVVRREDPAATVADLRGRRAAFNSVDSQSGYNALRAGVAPHAVAGRFFGEAIGTGAHRASMRAVAEGVADCAAVDAVVWALASRHAPRLAGALRVLAWSAPAPALPFITAAERSDGELAAIRDALVWTMSDPALSGAREAMLIAGLEVLPDGVYDTILEMEASAAAAGYPALG